MPLDVLGHTRATLVRSASFTTWPDTAGQSVKSHRDWDRPLQFLVVNEEFLVNASHQLALITSLPFVHTARRSYRLNDAMKSSEVVFENGSLFENMTEVA